MTGTVTTSNADTCTIAVESRKCRQITESSEVKKLGKMSVRIPEIQNPLILYRIVLIHRLILIHGNRRFMTVFTVAKKYGSEKRQR